MKLISSFDLFSRKQHWFRSKRRGYTTRSQTTAFCSYEKSYTFCEDMSARLLNAIKWGVNRGMQIKFIGKLVNVNVIVTMIISQVRRDDSLVTKF